MSLIPTIKLALNPAALLSAAGLVPDPWQADFLARRPHRGLLLCCRQAGKSTTAAAQALHQALAFPGSLVLLISPSLRQSDELFRKVLALYRALPNPPAPKRRRASALELDGGSRILSLPGQADTVRGFSRVSLLVIDEAARVPDDLYFAVRPMLAVSGGRLLALSTPWGRRGWFYRAWENPAEDWRRLRLDAAACPRISPEFLAQERRSLPPAWFRAEYCCEFAATRDQLFPHDLLLAAVSDAVPLLFPGDPSGWDDD